MGGWSPNGGSTSFFLLFNSYNRNYDLSCKNNTDKFSKNNNKTKLKYPIGLLSASEVLLAYYNASYSDYYLNTGSWYILNTPYYYHNYLAYTGSVYSMEYLIYDNANVIGGIRPSVSLKPGIEYASGDGSFTNPFVIE